MPPHGITGGSIAGKDGDEGSDADDRTTTQKGMPCGSLLTGQSLRADGQIKPCWVDCSKVNSKN